MVHQYESADSHGSSGESMPEADAVPVTEAQVLHALRHGVMTEDGLLPYSSNHSFLVTMTDDEMILPAVYKPQQGESPLWDFEWGTLCKRETAAYLLSHALGWDLVPPTVLRRGTRGLGSIQFYIENDSDDHYFTVQEDARFVDSFRRTAVFDYLINNADRKSGHCLVGADGRIWAIDHGICFHVEYKLRTVIWEFSGQPLEPDLHADLARLQPLLLTETEQLHHQLTGLLDRAEFAALLERLETLLGACVYPSPSVYRRNYPWPPI